MNRGISFLCALLFALVSVSSASIAVPSGLLHFTLEPDRTGTRIQASFRDNRREEGHGSNWSTSIVPAELSGFDLTGFRASGVRPVQFALVREAGRVDCTGEGGGSYAAGNCSFSRHPDFMRMLASRGIGQPNDEQAIELVAVDAHASLIDALARAHYPIPDVEKFVELSAVGVSPSYISGLAGQGYRPESLEKLVEFRALDITPEFIGSFERAGYRRLGADDLVQLRALDITPEFIASFSSIGYPNLPVHDLVQLKALDVTPAYVQSIINSGLAAKPSVNQLVQFKALSGDARHRHHN